MPKTIVICCDGTWNTPDDGTNIFRTFEILCASLGHDAPPKAAVPGECRFAGVAPDGRPHLIYYDAGVGTAPREKIRGGIFGFGLAANVQRPYRFLAAHWEPGDEVFCFGFSRGAFTVRALCGMLNAARLISDADEAAAETAYAYYRLTPAERPGSAEAEALAQCQRPAVRIRFLGVYDTVGSLGVPVPQLSFLNRLSSGAVGRWLLGDVSRFHDTRLGSNVEAACQALGIDERRGAFRPVVWSRPPMRYDLDNGSFGAQQVLQVWFCGAHADVGGGYGDNDLANAPLAWMLRRAAEAGLHVDERVLSATCSPNPWGARHDSTADFLGRLSGGFYLDMAKQLASSLPGVVSWPLRLLGLFEALRIAPWVRPIGGEHLADDRSYSVAVNEKVHASVLARYQGRPLPEVLQRVLAAGLPVFQERAELRTPVQDAKATIEGKPCRLVDLSPGGAQVAEVRTLDPKSRYIFESARTGQLEAWVRWQTGDRAGLSLGPVRTAERGLTERPRSAAAA